MVFLLTIFLYNTRTHTHSMHTCMSGVREIFANIMRYITKTLFYVENASSLAHSIFECVHTKPNTSFNGSKEMFSIQFSFSLPRIQVCTRFAYGLILFPSLFSVFSHFLFSLHTIRVAPIPFLCSYSCISMNPEQPKSLIEWC